MRIFLTSLQRCIEDQNWPAALCLALTLPEMAGAVEAPEAAPQKSYADWFDKWVGRKYRTPLLLGQQTFLSGADCYGLRSAMLYHAQDAPDSHRHKTFQSYDKFIFTLDPEAHCTRKNQRLHLHMARFCRDVEDGCEAWLASVKKDTRKAALLERSVKIEGTS